MTNKEEDINKLVNNLIKQQNTISPNSSVNGDGMYSNVKAWIPTGAIALDTILSNKEFGGFPVGRTIELYGEEAIGKSTLVFSTMGNVQKNGGIAIYYDVEQAGSEDMMRACGVDLSTLVTSNEVSLEKIFETMDANLNTKINTPGFKDKEVLICIDSIAQVEPNQEIEGGYGFNMNTSLKKAAQLGLAIRKITPLLNKAKAALVIINQLRDKPGVMFGNPKTTTSGNALKFAASIRIMLSSRGAVKMMDPIVEAEYKGLIDKWNEEVSKWKELPKNIRGDKPKKPKKPKGDEIIIGYDIVAKTDKNKVAPPKRYAEFRIIFSHGIVEEVAWFDYMLRFGEIYKETASTYKFRNEKIYTNSFSKSEFQDVINNIEVYNYIKKTIKRKLIRPLPTFKKISEVDDGKIKDNEKSKE